MGVYSSAPASNANYLTLVPGGTSIVWNAETPTPGNGTTAASTQVFFWPIGPLPVGGASSAFSVSGHFSGAPGAFEVDVQAAELDNDTDYQTISGGNITTVDAVNNTFHLDAWGVTTRYVRLLMRSRTNSVSITARVSR